MRKIPLVMVVVVLLLVGDALGNKEKDAELVEELMSMQESSSGGVIHLNDASLQKYAGRAKGRSYSLVIFFDAEQMKDNADLRLGELRQEFQLMASTFINNNRGQPSGRKVFFCDMEFKESQASFSMLGVNSLPHIRHVGPGNAKLKESEVMPQDGSARAAESMAAFVESKTKLSVGTIERPPAVTKKQAVFIAAALLAAAPFVVKQIAAGNTPVHEPKVWLAGAVFVYFFSVSGAMYNIIRKMPLFMADRQDPSKVVFFFQGSGMQLGAEGFAVGFLYTLVGLLLAFVTHVVPHVRSQNVQRLLMLVAMTLSFWAVKKVISLDHWKTGYAIHGFWPSSWN
uniref:TSA: Wollemia nobilis Ref_Wollemi_Transcript_18907_1256 transcribed RNA sequence n=1 Tax=Wollemia nobilis TaxID=56998 RepID=A0A0C9S5K5_9CONI